MIRILKKKQVEEKIARLEKIIEEPGMVSHKQSEDIAFISQKGLDVGAGGFSMHKAKEYLKL